MPTHTLNIIYDTNYTNIINWWGFVDHQFSSNSEKNTWNIEVITWESKNNIPQVENQTTDTWTTNQQQWQKTPWFMDLLFWPLNSQNTNNNTNWNTQTNEIHAEQQIQQTQIQTQPMEQAWSITAASQNVASGLQAGAAVATQNITQSTWSTNVEEAPKNAKKKSWLDSMLDNIFWTDEWSQKNKKTEESGKRTS